MKQNGASSQQQRAAGSPLHSSYQLRWKSYRRFRDTGWLTVRPITVLIGPNNSGKSSVLSPLLLMSQTIASSDNETPLVTRGPLADVGNYGDFIHKHERHRELFFGLRFHYHEPKKKLRPVGYYPPGAVEMTFTEGQEPQQLRLKKYEVLDIFNRSYLARTLLTDSTYALKGAVERDKLAEYERKAVAAARPVNFLFSPDRTLSQIKFPESESEGVRPGRFSESFSHYLRAVSYSYSGIRSLFQTLSYVGPLRQKIQRYYRVAGETSSVVGPQGEHALHIFRRDQKQLQAEVNYWVGQFELGDSLSCEQLNSDLFEVVLKSGSEKTNLADVGFGASQVLPLIIQALAAPENSLTLAEQPEIHLNPKLQCILADLLVHMANSGHRVVIETHSEHLLVRLRRLVASGKISEQDVAVYFVEREADESKIREVPIRSNGHIERTDWPSGFFEDSLRESLALAKAQAVALERN